MLSFKRSSLLQTSPERLWQHAGSMTGVNRELFPMAQMTVPGEFKDLHLSQATTGRPLFRSWILFLGLIPIDYDEITIVEIFPGGGFQERSKMATNRIWAHKRTIVQEQAFCRITDEVEFQPVIHIVGLLMLPLYRLTFWLRHFNLQRIFKSPQ